MISTRIWQALRLPLALFALIGGAILPAVAQEEEDTSPVPIMTLLNLDTPELPQPRQGLYHFDIRASGGTEGKTYYGIGAQFGLARNFSLLARATFSDPRLFTNSVIPIRHGGHEAEIAGKWLLLDRGDVKWAMQAGVLFPHTGLRRAVAGTVQSLLSRKLGEKTTVYFVPKLILQDRTLLTLGGGVHYRFNSDWDLFGDIQGAVSGDNTFRTDTGGRTKQEVWGVGFRYTPSAYRGQVSLDLGVTNGLGRTTGYSTQPGLAGNTAFYVQFLYRK